jgi:hypothetical protein
MKTKSANKATSTPASTGVGLCVDGKAHSFRAVSPDGKDYNSGATFFLVEREIEGADGKKYTEKKKDYGVKFVFCSKCARKEQI